MRRLMFFIVEKATASLRGEISRWCMELKPGVFVGSLRKRVGSKLWKLICDKIKDGRHLWVYTMDNEQGFEIKASENYLRKFRDFEGLTLMTIPKKHAVRKEDKIFTQKIGSLLSDNLGEIIEGKSMDSIATQTQNGSNKKENLKFMNANKDKDLGVGINLKFHDDELSWRELYKARGIPDSIPTNFIIRRAVYRLKSNLVLESQYDGLSTFPQINNKGVWLPRWQSDEENIALKILKFMNANKSLILPHLYNKKVVSFDIETTNYKPMIYNGYVNIVGLSWIDLTNFDNDPTIILNLLQIFNMERDVNKAPFLVVLSQKILESADIGIVFNASFDVYLLKLLAKKIGIKDLKMPANLIDYQDYYDSLKDLEEQLNRLTGFHRLLSKKGKYDQYYNKFKKYKKQKDCIEPIGTYNLLDTLTPLYMFLIDLVNGKF
ncbi:MAG: type I-E CRISPR-associated endoribonuclease Cas2e [Promethearchaeota archaeon]